MDQYFDIIIVGGGPAGLTAAVYARRAGKSVLLLERESFGGQIASSPKVENFPGLPAVSGAELAERLYSQAEALGTRIELEEALEIQSGTPSRVVTDYGAYTAGAVILAAGMRRRTLGLAGEDRLAGISFCAVCDGAFYAGQDVAVAGGGSTALQDALYLADICRHVTVIHRRSDFRADPILVERAEKTANLTLLRSTVVEALEGSERLTGLTLRNTAVGEVSHLPVSALFQAVGLLPESRLARSLGVPVDEAGFIAAGEDCLTPIPGIFAAGDLRAKEVRQLTTACADGAVAAASVFDAGPPSQESVQAAGRSRRPVLFSSLLQKRGRFFGLGGIARNRSPNGKAAAGFSAAAWRLFDGKGDGDGDLLFSQQPALRHAVGPGGQDAAPVQLSPAEGKLPALSRGQLIGNGDGVHFLVHLIPAAVHLPIETVVRPIGEGLLRRILQYHNRAGGSALLQLHRQPLRRRRQGSRGHPAQEQPLGQNGQLLPGDVLRRLQLRGAAGEPQAVPHGPLDSLPTPGWDGIRVPVSGQIPVAPLLQRQIRGLGIAVQHHRRLLAGHRRRRTEGTACIAPCDAAGLGPTERLEIRGPGAHIPEGCGAALADHRSAAVGHMGVIQGVCKGPAAHRVQRCASSPAGGTAQQQAGAQAQYPTSPDPTSHSASRSPSLFFLTPCAVRAIRTGKPAGA